MTYVIGPFRLDTARAALFRGVEEVKLRPQAYDLLVHLVQNSGRLVTKQELFEAVWRGTAVTDDALVQCVMDLRRALADGGPDLIRTIPRRGYILDLPADAAPAPAAASVSTPAAAEPPPSPAPDIASGRGRARFVLTVSALAVVLAASVWAIGRSRAWFGTPAADAIRSIAVLPLENLSGDPSQEFFADGMTDELITDLAQLDTLSVISRTSVMRFKGTHPPLVDIARELKSDAIIEGSVKRAGSRVRITAQLIDGRTDHHLWARSFDGDVGDVLILQSQVARAIAEQVRARLTPAAEAHWAARPRLDPSVEEAYLLGLYHVNKGTEAEITRGIESFRDALAHDPRDAQSHAGLALAYLALSDYYVPPASVLPQARDAALAAVAVDDTRAEAHLALGAVRFLYDWDWPSAEHEFTRALELNPGSADAHIWYAVFLAQMGRAEPARAEVRQAERLDPLSLGVRVQGGWVAYLARDYAEAMLEWRAARDLEPQFAPSHTSIWVAYLPQSDFGAALPASGQDDGLSLAARLGGFAANGNAVEAKRALAALTALSRHAYVCPYEMATASSMMGNADEAIDWLKKGVAERSACIPDMKTDPRLDRLRSDPRFVELLKRVKFPQ